MRYLTRCATPVLLIILSAVGLSACGSSSSVPDDSLGGTVNGLQAGNSVVLQNNVVDNLTVAQSGQFTFPNGFAPGSSYAVTILTQPAGQSCVVVNGSGVLPGTVSVLGSPGAHGVSDIVVNCSAGAGPFTVSGTVAGLLPGNTVVLQDNGGNDASVSASGGFVFSTPLASGSAYAVTVLTQPPGQNCAIGNGSGAAILENVANVAVVCSDNTFNIAAVVSGLLANHSLVLQLNGANNLTVSANGTATFNAPIASGSTYAVTVLYGDQRHGHGDRRQHQQCRGHLFTHDVYRGRYGLRTDRYGGASGQCRGQFVGYHKRQFRVQHAGRERLGLCGNGFNPARRTDLRSE
jgi:hypothetical protein